MTVQNLVSPGRRCHVRQAGKVAVLSHEAAVPFVRVTRQLLLAESFRHGGWCFRARERRTRWINGEISMAARVSPTSTRYNGCDRLFNGPVPFRTNNTRSTPLELRKKLATLIRNGDRFAHYDRTRDSCRMYVEPSVVPLWFTMASPHPTRHLIDTEAPTPTAICSPVIVNHDMSTSDTAPFTFPPGC